jgi:hypothetical protein
VANAGPIAANFRPEQIIAILEKKYGRLAVQKASLLPPDVVHALETGTAEDLDAWLHPDHSLLPADVREKMKHTIALTHHTHHGGHGENATTPKKVTPEMEWHGKNMLSGQEFCRHCEENEDARGRKARAACVEEMPVLNALRDTAISAGIWSCLFTEEGTVMAKQGRGFCKEGVQVCLHMVDPKEAAKVAASEETKAEGLEAKAEAAETMSVVDTMSEKQRGQRAEEVAEAAREADLNFEKTKKACFAGKYLRVPQGQGLHPRVYSCESCTAGQYQPYSGQGGCYDCHAGQVSSPGSQKCFLGAVTSTANCKRLPAVCKRAASAPTPYVSPVLPGEQRWAPNATAEETNIDDAEDESFWRNLKLPTGTPTKAPSPFPTPTPTIHPTFRDLVKTPPPAQPPTPPTTKAPTPPRGFVDDDGVEAARKHGGNVVTMSSLWSKAPTPVATLPPPTPPPAAKSPKGMEAFWDQMKEQLVGVAQVKESKQKDLEDIRKIKALEAEATAQEAAERKADEAKKAREAEELVAAALAEKDRVLKEKALALKATEAAKVAAKEAEAAAKAAKVKAAKDALALETAEAEEQAEEEAWEQQQKAMLDKAKAIEAEEAKAEADANADALAKAAAAKKIGAPGLPVTKQGAGASQKLLVTSFESGVQPGQPGYVTPLTTRLSEWLHKVIAMKDRWQAGEFK